MNATITETCNFQISRWSLGFHNDYLIQVFYPETGKVVNVCGPAYVTYREALAAAAKLAQKHQRPLLAWGRTIRRPSDVEAMKKAAHDELLYGGKEVAA